jgi:hypothetical protein
MLTLPAVLMLPIDILLSAFGETSPAGGSAEGAPVFSCESNNDGASNSRQQRVSGEL